MSVEKICEELVVEGAVCNLRRRLLPPLWFDLAVTKTDAPKLPWIAKHERPIPLTQDEMIVCTGAKTCRFKAQRSAHSEVNAEGVCAGKFEEHLLAACDGAQQPGADQMLPERVSVCATKDALCGMQFDRRNALADRAFPLATVELDFGQFRHRVSLQLR